MNKNDDIFAKLRGGPKNDTPTVLNVPEMGGEIRLRTITFATRLNFDSESAFLKDKLPKDESDKLSMPRAVAWTLVDADGKLLFELPSLAAMKEAATKAEFEGQNPELVLRPMLDVYYQFDQFSGRAFMRVFNAAWRLNFKDPDRDFIIEPNDE